jgi:drug/metabolite transporter (DMT)-like permease
MQSGLLYVSTVLIWGSTWFAITFQLGTVDALVSIAHRMALSAVLTLLIIALRRGSPGLELRYHPRILLLGLFLFSCNYLFVYAGTALLSSGLVAVVFSSMVVLNAIGGALFLGDRLRPAVLLGGAIGMLGMGLLFWPELESLSWEDERLRGLLVCLLGTLCASAGNMVAAGNIRRGLPVLACNCWGMIYGALVLYLAALLLGVPIRVDWRPDYLWSLLYLALFGTVLAFWAYISLIGRIGADRAAYTTLLFPVVALMLSSYLEDYRWSLWSLCGLALVLTGNWLAMRGTRA